MTKHILIFEPRIHKASELAARIEAAGDYVVSRVGSMREAGALLTTQKQDLALIPITRHDSLVYTLRVLQPGLPIFLLRNDIDDYIPERQRQAVAGIIDREAVPYALAHLISGTWTERDLRYWPRRRLPELRNLNPSRLQAILRSTLLDDSLHVVLIQHEAHLYHEQTAVGESLLAAVFARLQETLEPDTVAAQMTFLTKTKSNDNLFLFSKQIARAVYVTFGAEINTSISRLQRLTQNVAKQTLDNTLPVKHIPIVPEGATSFALVWQAKEEIAIGIVPVIRNILTQIAKVYNCDITFLEIEENYVHMVVTVPAERSSGWAARIFKQHSGKLLSKALSIKDDYWQAGFLARESDYRLSEVELNLYLKSAKLPKPDSRL